LAAETLVKASLDLSNRSRLILIQMITDNKKRLLGLLLITLLLLSSCSAPTGNNEYFGKLLPPEGQVLRYIIGPEPQTLDPQFMTGVGDALVVRALFDGLVDYDEKTVGPIPSLATHWDINENGTIWIFHLRQDAKWSDGKPINAHDFVYSWHRALSPEFAAPYSSMMYVIRHGQAYNEQKSFVRDPRTGKFATTKDLTNSKKDGSINCTGTQPSNFSSDPHPEENREDYLLVPNSIEDRAKLESQDKELARFLKSKEFLPVTKEHIGIKALDDYTFQVVLQSPTAYFIKAIAHQFFRPVPRQSIDKWGDALWIKPDKIVTSGAFKMAQWNPYDKIIVERNPLFWDNSNTKLDKIIFIAQEELATVMNLYKAGEADAMISNQPPPPWRNYLKSYKDYIYGPFLSVEYIAINTTMPPLNDLRVRRAFSMAINRQIFADRAPGRTPLTCFTPPMDGYENPKGTDYNPDQARKLLAEAGFPNGKGFPQIEILYNTAESNKQIMELAQSMLKRELNIPVELTNQEWRVYLESTRANRRTYKGLARRGWVGDYVDPNTFLELLTSGSINNSTGWKDPKYDALLEAANSEIDPEKRARKLNEAESYMLEQQPIIPLYVNPTAFMCKPYVKNLVSNLLDTHNWREVYIDHQWQDSNQ
jgi:oligopeptide transport system substrate-binding protein